MADPRELKTVDQLWEELLTPRESGGYDSSLADAVHHILSLYKAPTPGSARERARQRVFDYYPASQQEDTMTAMNAPIPFPLSGGTTRATPASWWPESGFRGKRAHWALASTAAALIILLGGIGGYLLHEDRDNHPALVPAVTDEQTQEADWPTWKGDAARTGAADAGPTGQPIELWRFQAQGPCDEPPIVVDQTAYVGCSETSLYALSTIDGNERWRFVAEGPIRGSVAHANSTVYVTDSTGRLYAIDSSSGEELWRSEPLELDQIAIDSGIVVAGGETGVLHAFDAKSGNQLWEYEIASQEELTYPAIAGDIVYASGGGGVTAVDLKTGDLIWRKENGASGWDAPSVTDDVAVVGISGELGPGKIVAYDAETGDELWRRDEAVFTPSVIGNVAYSGSVSGTVYAFALSDGALLWQAQVGGEAWPGAVTEEVIYVSSDGDEAVYALDASNGQELWRLDVDDRMQNTVAVDRGRMYVATLAGSVYAIGGSNDPLIAAPSGQQAASASASDVDVPMSFDVDALSLQPVNYGDFSFMMPQGITTDPQGNFYIADGALGQVVVLGPDGALITTIGDDSGSGMLEVPTSAAVDAAGNIYVASENTDKIWKFGPDGTFLDAWPVVGEDSENVFGGAAVSTDANQNRLWVTDWENHRVRVFDLEGDLLFEFGEFGAGQGQLRFPLTVSFDEHWNAYVPEYAGGRVSVFSDDGEFQFSFGEDQLVGPTQTAINASGYVFVADQEVNRIFVFGRDGTFLAEFGPDGTDATTCARSTGIAFN
ncbi:MAG: PQQ-binding-like beta-propeller repeat protein, partial [Thermomicrobiales bacterium]